MDQDIQEDTSENSNQLGEKNLEEEERVELDIYRRVRKDPFFTHYMKNEFRYFSERMKDGLQNTIKEHADYYEEDNMLPYYDLNALKTSIAQG